MKKKALIIIPIALAVTLILVFAFGRPKEPVQTQQEAPVSNPSRRGEEGENASGDEDLAQLDGSGIEGNSDPQKKNEEQPVLLKPSIIEGNVNNPVCENVQIVRKISLPEAVTMGEGDIGGFYNNDDFKDVIPVDIRSFSAADVPVGYDSRNVDGKNYVTNVEDQGYTYLCWTYCALGAIESDLIIHHEDIGRDNIDLSEKHMAYYNMHRAPGSYLGLIDDDYRELENAEKEDNAWIFDYDTNYVSVGGVTNFCISLLTAWKGPVEEKNDDAFASMYGNRYIFTDNTAKPSDAYESRYHVQGAYEIPAISDNRTLIKQMIMEHGGATIGVRADDRFWKNHCATLNAHYDSSPEEIPNHEVLIIGWDDDYDASHFRIKPEGNGAWICKNSWGTSSGKEGFFYLSYYDETAKTSNAVAYDVAAEGDDNWYDNNYQTAGFLSKAESCLDDSLNTVYAYSSAANPYGILYEAGSDETLSAVGFMSLDMYQQYEIDIYVNPNDLDDSISFETQGMPALMQKVSAISGGFHTFELEEQIELAQGDKFFILIKPVTQGRLVFEQEDDSVSRPNYDEWNNLTGNIHNNYVSSGRSYYISDDGQSMNKQEDKDFFIKAYTVNR